MNKLCMEFNLELPSWCKDYMSQYPDIIESIEDRMKLIIDLSRLNIRHNTGGPFAAGVFESNSGKIIAVGVNRVMPTNCSSAHAEIMALSLAQKRLGVYDLGGENLPEHDFFVNWLPCTMCYGATIWSGIKRLVIAGQGKELEEITGFDEGPRPDDWEGELNKRGIKVINNVLREEAVNVYKEFRDNNNFVYNARLGNNNC